MKYSFGHFPVQLFFVTVFRMIIDKILGENFLFRAIFCFVESSSYCQQFHVPKFHASDIPCSPFFLSDRRKPEKKRKMKSLVFHFPLEGDQADLNK